MKIIAGETGYDRNVVHEYNKKHFGFRVNEVIGGETIEIIHGTRYSKEKTAHFIDQVIMFWSEKLSVYFPEPGELTQEQYVDAFNETTGHESD